MIPHSLTRSRRVVGLDILYPLLLCLSVLGLCAFAACTPTDDLAGPESSGAEPDLGTPFKITPTPTAVGFADSYGIWKPSGTDTCSKEVHDQYSAVGPDGLEYPTWHPPVDPATGCWFGHEHGADPRSSDLYGLVGDIPFGYANQHLIESGFPAHRHEDHVGHKVEFFNDLLMETEGPRVVCDVLAKLHQGTHSPDAFTNNLHELAYHIRCDDGTGMSVTVLSQLGVPGQLVDCLDADVNVGTATPPQSPAGDGVRLIPTRACLDALVEDELEEAFLETWENEVFITAGSDEEDDLLAEFSPYFQVFDPSRFFDPSLHNNLGRSIDVCRAAGGELAEICLEWGSSDVAWDHPDAPFKGAVRGLDVNGNLVNNANGPNIWYTDPFGRRASVTPFPGSLRQWIARIDNTDREVDGGGSLQVTDYDAPGVRAIN